MKTDQKQNPLIYCLHTSEAALLFALCMELGLAKDGRFPQDKVLSPPATPSGKPLNTLTKNGDSGRGVLAERQPR